MVTTASGGDGRPAAGATLGGALEPFDVSAAFDVSGPGRLLSRDGLLALLSLLTRIYRASANGPEVLAGSAIGFAASLLGRLAR